MNSKGSLKISFDPNGIPFHDLNVLERNSPRKRNLLLSIQNSDFIQHSSNRIKNFPPKKFHSLNLCNDAIKKSSSRNYFKFNSKKRHYSPNTYTTKIQTSSNIFDRTKNLGNLFQKKITNISLILDP